MKRTSLKKLELNRETIRGLQPEQLQAVEGGGWTAQSCWNSCTFETRWCGVTQLSCPCE
jgi:hypothetical protein